MKPGYSPSTLLPLTMNPKALQKDKSLVSNEVQFPHNSSRREIGVLRPRVPNSSISQSKTKKHNPPPTRQISLFFKKIPPVTKLVVLTRFVI